MTVRDLIRWEQSHIPVHNRKRFNHSLMTLQNEMSDLVDTFFGAVSKGLSKEPFFPLIDIIEDEKSFKIKAEVPGIPPETITATVTDGYLNIQGEKTEHKNEKSDQYIRHESSHGIFNRVIELPLSADCEKAEASVKNGAVYISIPKKADFLKRCKHIEIKKSD